MLVERRRALRRPTRRWLGIPQRAREQSSDEQVYTNRESWLALTYRMEHLWSSVRTGISQAANAKRAFDLIVNLVQGGHASCGSSASLGVRYSMIGNGGSPKLSYQIEIVETGGGHRVIFASVWSNKPPQVSSAGYAFSEGRLSRTKARVSLLVSPHRFRSQDQPLPGPSTTIPHEEIFAGIGVFFTVHLRLDYNIASYPPFLALTLSHSCFAVIQALPLGDP